MFSQKWTRVSALNICLTLWFIFSSATLGAPPGREQAVVCRQHVRADMRGGGLETNTSHHVVEGKHPHEEHQGDCEYFNLLLTIFNLGKCHVRLVGET